MALAEASTVAWALAATFVAAVDTHLHTFLAAFHELVVAFAVGRDAAAIGSGIARRFAHEVINGLHRQFVAGRATHVRVVLRQGAVLHGLRIFRRGGRRRHYGRRHGAVRVLGYFRRAVVFQLDVFRRVARGQDQRIARADEGEAAALAGAITALTVLDAVFTDHPIENLVMAAFILRVGALIGGNDVARVRRELHPRTVFTRGIGKATRDFDFLISHG